MTTKPLMPLLLLLAACHSEPPPQAGGSSPVSAAPAVTPARSQDLAQVARGERIYEANCRACHGARGQATPDWRQRGPDGKFPPPPLDGSAHAWHHPTWQLRAVIEEGSPPGQGNMPAWKGKLSDREIDDVIAYVKSLWPDEIYARWYRQVESRPPRETGK